MKNYWGGGGEKLWKSRAKDALGNRRSDFHFPTASATTKTFGNYTVNFLERFPQ